MLKRYNSGLAEQAGPRMQQERRLENVEGIYC
jgi:hypothetical protein